MAWSMKEPEPGPLWILSSEPQTWAPSLCPALPADAPAQAVSAPCPQAGILQEENIPAGCVWVVGSPHPKFLTQAFHWEQCQDTFCPFSSLSPCWCCSSPASSQILPTTLADLEGTTVQVIYLFPE